MQSQRGWTTRALVNEAAIVGADFKKCQLKTQFSVNGRKHVDWQEAA
jgi:hypothetical protein